MVRPIRTFAVVPSLPAPLEGLREIAFNLRWAWDHETISLFRRLDMDLWERSGHNPVLMLGALDQAQLDTAAADEAFLAHLQRVSVDLAAYMAGESSWFRRLHGAAAGPLVAYFSAEFGITETLSIFAGGLGLLAGDHLKSASDLGVPLVGVGLLYQQGYFRQYLNEAGWQQEAYVENDFHNLPLALERRPDGVPLTVEVAYPGRPVLAQVWRAQVGRVPLYLLDTNIPANRLEDRDIADQLYGGDLEMRLRQEIMLGIGGYRALQALSLEPAVYHLNEGHAAFLALERVRHLMETQGLSFAEAREAAAAGLVFTTHTPVPAGHDYFPPSQVELYFGDYARTLGLSFHDLMGLGRWDPADEGQHFGTTVLALRLADHRNAVSRLHGEVTRRMWQGLWPGVPEAEVPIGHVTNGVHFKSWISHELDQLYDRYLGPRWREEPADQAAWRRIEQVPPGELWGTHERRRERLVAFARGRLRSQLQQRGRPPAELEAADTVLDPGALTIGFARRFATYKRANLIFRDPVRLARLLNEAQRPVQLIIAGKAHPRDEPGKELIRHIVSLSREEPFRRRLVFLENYDMAVARYLVQGADVWLNTPRRLQEASGTSGMKAAANGVLNLSTLDGWWDEAWSDFGLPILDFGFDRNRDSKIQNPKSEMPMGWAIGRGEIYEDAEYQDQVEAAALYDLLEQEVVPGFYDRGPDGLPRRWIARMQASIAALAPYFNTHRMVGEYTSRFYLPAAERSGQLAAEGLAQARALAAWEARVRELWPQVHVDAVDAEPAGPLETGGKVRARAWIHLGGLTPDDVQVELYLGRVAPAGEFVDAEATILQTTGAEGDGRYVFEGSAAPCRRSGLHGYSVRVLPWHPGLATSFLPGLIAWAGPDVKAS